MTNQELINKLKVIKKIQPDETWLKLSRERLLAQIANQKTVSSSHQGLAEVFYFGQLFKQLSKNFVLQPVGTFVLMLAIVLGGGVVKVQADASLPGDFLYAFKQGGQQLRLMLARRDDQRIKLQLEFTDRHLDELTQIAEQSNFATSDKEERLREALNIFQADLVYLNNNLQSIDSQTDVSGAVAAAQKVDEKTNLYQLVLKQTERKMATGKIQTEVRKTIKAVDETETKALTMIVSKHQQGQSQISSQEVALRIEGKIKQATDALDELGKTLMATSVDGKINEAKTNSQKAQNMLDQAKQDLANQEFVIALEKIKTSQEIFNEAKDSVAETTTTATSTETNVNAGLIRENSINILTPTSSEKGFGSAPADPEMPAQTPQTLK